MIKEVPELHDLLLFSLAEGSVVIVLADLIVQGSNDIKVTEKSERTEKMTVNTTYTPCKEEYGNAYKGGRNL